MTAIFEILANLFSDAEFDVIKDTIVGFLTEYDVSAAVDTIVSFFGGMFQ